MARTPYIRHLRHRWLERTRHSKIFLAWLEATATRLSTTVATVFAALKAGHSTAEIDNYQGAYPTNTVAPAITGTPTVGQNLTCSTGTWTGTATITYARQWMRDGVDIAGATSATYALVGADQTRTITCEVTATNSLGSITALSNAVGPIA